MLHRGKCKKQDINSARTLLKKKIKKKKELEQKEKKKKLKEKWKRKKIPVAFTDI